MPTLQVVESKFDSAKGRDIKYMYLDACYDEDDDDSREAFDNSMEELYRDRRQNVAPEMEGN